MDLIVFWICLLVIVVAYMTLWYGISLYTKRLDVVDTAWGLGFVVVAWVSLALRGNFGSIAVVSAILTSIWGLRLAAHIANRNWKKSEDDHRYQELRTKWGDKQYKVYTNVFLLQGALMTLISLPMIAIAFHRDTANLFHYIGWVIWLGGIIFEATADLQLGRFIQRRDPESHAIMDKGLWRYSRHPNYFGEVTVWWGAAIVALASGQWWGILGALLITVLITKVSGIPPLERHYDGNSKYEAYRKRTSVFVPLPPRVK